MKKILFSAVSLDVGGIEKALVMLLNNLADKYDVTLVLENNSGIFKSEINTKINIVEYKISSIQNVLLRKLDNFIRQRKFAIKYRNKYDFSCSFATYSRPGSFVARTASKNSILWCHMDYLSQYKGDKEKVKKFFEDVKFDEFKKLVFVSKKSLETFLQVYPYMKEKAVHINNMIDYEKIIKDSEEIINIKRECYTFVNVSRHDEEQKKISRIIESAKILKDKNINFKIILVGDGPDNKKYKEKVTNKNLAENVIFVGRKKNPYPYIKSADCMILTSDYEGSPVSFVEAFVLDKPIITTDVAGSEQINNSNGVVIEKDVSKIAETMQNFIENGYKTTEKFDAKKYNNEIIENLEKLMQG